MGWGEHQKRIVFSIKLRIHPARPCKRWVPEDRIMVETDAPYLSPEPLRGTHPNVPANVIITPKSASVIM